MKLTGHLELLGPGLFPDCAAVLERTVRKVLDGGAGWTRAPKLGGRRPSQQMFLTALCLLRERGPLRGQLSEEEAPTPCQGRREGAQSTGRKGSSTVKWLRNQMGPHRTVY